MISAEQKLAVSELICSRIVAGIPIATIFGEQREHEAEIPTKRTWAKWRREDASLQFMFQQAVRDRVDYFALEMADIADNESLSPESRKVRIGTRQWLLARIFRDAYGERLTVAGDPNAPIEHHHTATLESKLLPELARLPAPAAAGKPNRSRENGAAL